MLFIIENCFDAPLCKARALFCVRASTVSGVSLSQYLGLKVALATPREKLSFCWSQSPGGLDASGTPAIEKAPPRPPPPEGGGGFSGGGGGTSGWPASVRGLCGGGWSESISIFSSWFVGFSCSLLVLRDMMMNKKNLSWLIS